MLKHAGLAFTLVEQKEHVRPVRAILLSGQFFRRVANAPNARDEIIPIGFMDSLSLPQARGRPQPWEEAARALRPPAWKFPQRQARRTKFLFFA
jgi:hypothetical protein